MCVATVTLSLAQTPRIGTSGSKQPGATTSAPTGHSALNGTSRLLRKQGQCRIGTNRSEPMSERTPGQTLVCRAGSAIKPLGSPAPLPDSVARAVPRRGPHRLARMPGLARLRRRALLILANSSLRPLPSAEISRQRGSLPRRYHRPRSLQLQLRPRRHRSDASLAAQSMRRTRTQRRLAVRPRFRQ